MKSKRIPETPAGYLARAKAVFKIGRCRFRGCTIAAHEGTLGEFLHQADVEGC